MKNRVFIIEVLNISIQELKPVIFPGLLSEHTPIDLEKDGRPFVAGSIIVSILSMAPRTGLLAAKRILFSPVG